MHPPNLKLMDTTNRVRSCGEHSFGKGKEISNSIREALLHHVEAIEASFGVNTETGRRGENSKDQDKSGEPFDAGCGVNPASVFPCQHSFSEQWKENICGENLAVDNGKNKEANVEGGCGVNPVSDDLPQENCIVKEKENSCGAEMAVDNEQFGLRGAEMAVDSGENKGDHMGENEDDDGDYDYNYWHEYCRNDCVTDEDDDDDFEASPPKRRGGGYSGTNHNRRYGRRVVEAKYLENWRLVEVNDQVLRAGINQRKRLAFGNVLR
ncbi:hypothetical protein DY000_02014078 [Brassica cretica]|uniref:Uncharacterized protein n=1 Tax=Brassica cretica TaxID=69181 RepID=A0ABQ7CRJ4_BRACR|nr:hypothetical protein DY000_02014078 [Brassica cretica]